MQLLGFELHRLPATEKHNKLFTLLKGTVKTAVGFPKTVPVTHFLRGEGEEKDRKQK